MRFIFSVLTLLCLCGVARADFEPIAIPTDDKPLQAVLYRPAGEGPFPFVIALPGCNGLRKQTGEIRSLWEGWGRRLSQAGFGVIFPDSYSSRGLAAQCRDKPNRPHASQLRPERERVADILAAREWLQQQYFARKDRIALLGWDSGAIAVLWAVRPNQDPDDELPDFRSAAVLYPGCQRLNDTAWSARIPTLVLIGARDDRTHVKACEQMVAGARGRSARAVIVKYRGANHAFDDTHVKPAHKRSNPTPASSRLNLGDVEARTDAFKRIPEWLSR